MMSHEPGPLFSEHEESPEGGSVRDPAASLSRTPLLAMEAAAYGPDRPRPAGDPIGQRGLPAERGPLDALVVRMCERLRAAGQAWLSGEQLANHLDVEGTRAVRLLAAYARVWHRVRAVQAMPGRGYTWGDAWGEEFYRRVSSQCRRMGRCYLCLAAVAAGSRAGDELRQLWLPMDGQEDELAAMLGMESSR